jgi:hypothetical protein
MRCLTGNEVVCSSELRTFSTGGEKRLTLEDVAVISKLGMIGFQETDNKGQSNSLTAIWGKKVGKMLGTSSARGHFDRNLTYQGRPPKVGQAKSDIQAKSGLILHLDRYDRVIERDKDGQKPVAMKRSKSPLSEEVGRISPMI